jgi:serine/threonine-protein kinase
MEHSGIAIGAVLAGRYRIDRVLGQGGMGIVVQAMHLQLHQPVAMKFLLPEVLANQQVVQRFLREAQAAVRLKSEHVARVIDVGTLETGAPYMVLEYLEGADLSNFPRAQLSTGQIIDLILQSCEALAEAHSLGIVHRDIKPANFFITRSADGTLLLKVLDFGISKTSALAGNLTATQAVMGTPAYMSPEQMRSSRDVDHRSDIWALGVVLYELLQGVPPFGGDTFSSMVLKVVNDPLPRLTVALPGDLEAIIYRCLEKDPAKRFQNTAELAQALARYAQSEVQAAVSVQRTRSIIGTRSQHAALAPTIAARPPSTISGAAMGGTVPPRSAARRWPIAAVAVAVVAVIVVAVVASVGGKSPGKLDGPASATQPEPAAKPVSPPARETPISASSGTATPPGQPVALSPATAPATTPPAATPPPVASSLQPATPPSPATPPVDAGEAAALPATPAGSPAVAKPVTPPAEKPKKSKSSGKKEAARSSDEDILGTRN